MDHFLALFGFTRTSKGGSFGTEFDATSQAFAIFGNDIDADGFYNYARVSSDYTFDINSFPGAVRKRKDLRYFTYTQRTAG
jgi:hypothetical protein